MSALPALPGYEVLRQIGSGGMGEVFHAARTAAGGFRKDVALKRLSRDHAVDGKSVQRFLQEARLCARFEHPNVVRVHDLIETEGGYFLVMELLRGASLHELLPLLPLSSAPPWVPLFALASDVLAALDYVHAVTGDDGRPLGLVHRDLTPRNLFVCLDGTVKILDFGIAKLVSALTPALTAHGTIAGTLDYLSPEAAAAKPLDARSDLFQLGAVLYRALTGEPLWGHGSSAELLARATAGVFEPLEKTRPGLPPMVTALVDRALATDPGARFPTAAAMRTAVQAALAAAPPSEPRSLAPLAARLAGREDLPLELAPTAPLKPGAPAPAKRVLITRRSAIIAGGAAAAAAAGGGFWLGQERRPAAAPVPAPGAARPGWPEYRRLTFRRGLVHHARFTPESRGIVYSAAFGADPGDLFTGYVDNAEARPLQLPGSVLLSASKSGDLFVLTDVEHVYGFIDRGTLARTALAGGGLRAELEDVQHAEAGADGSLLLVRWSGEKTTLEYPMGKVLFESDVEWVGSPRLSPRGDQIAFIRHPARFDDRGTVGVIDRNGRLAGVGSEWVSARGLAWQSDVTVWVSATHQGVARGLHALSLSGREKVLASAPLSLQLDDLRDGRALVQRELTEYAVPFGRFGGRALRDLAWFDASFPIDLTSDGKQLLLTDGGGDATQQAAGVYLRSTEGGTAVRLADGLAAALSPDAKWALVIADKWSRLRLVPTGPGEAQELPLDGISGLQYACFFPGGKKVLFAAQTVGGQKLFEVELGGGRPKVLNVRGHFWRRGPCVVDGGKALVLEDPKEQRLRRVPLEDGPVTDIGGAVPGDLAVRVCDDGKTLVVRDNRLGGINVFKIDMRSGRRESLGTLAPDDPAGLGPMDFLVVSGNAQWWSYAGARILTTLYRVEGLS